MLTHKEQVNHYLQKMKEYYDDHDWIQGVGHRRIEGVTVGSCLRGAIHNCVPGGFTGPIYDVLRAHTGTWQLHEWNDMPGRTKEEVIQLLERSKL